MSNVCWSSYGTDDDDDEEREEEMWKRWEEEEIVVVEGKDRERRVLDRVVCV